MNFRARLERRAELDEAVFGTKKPKLEITQNERTRRYLKKFGIEASENDNEIDKIDAFLKEYKGFFSM